MRSATGRCRDRNVAAPDLTLRDAVGTDARAHVLPMKRFTPPSVRRARSDETCAWATTLGCLGKTIVSTKTFSEVREVFHGELATDPAFVAAGTLQQNATLRAIIEQVLRSIAPGGSLTNLVLLHIASHGVWHGGASWSDGLVTVLYFEDPNVGVVSYTPSLDGSSIHDVRFTRVDVRGRGFPGSSSRGSA
jgi:hypothetical protein